MTRPLCLARVHERVVAEPWGAPPQLSVDEWIEVLAWIERETHEEIGAGMSDRVVRVKRT